MHYTDSVYGPVTITEPVLIDLMATQAVQRLKHILQHGITGFLGITQPITRFDHSVGVMLLARQLGAPLKEQVAALLHDVSHTAFSHVMDHVFSEPTGQSYHERMKAAYLEQSDIPPVLARYGYDWREFVHEAAYPILEQDAPALCADRLDYFFRDGLALSLLTAEEAIKAVSHLRVQNEQIGVDDLPTAQWLAYTYMKADESSWSNSQAIGLYELMAGLIRTGLRLSAISEADVWLTDQAFWNKLVSCPDQALQRQVIQLTSPIRFIEAKTNPWRELRPKIRTIDPIVWGEGAGIRLSDLDADYGHALAAYHQQKRGILSLAIGS
ncbi:HD domain-containing protein [Spirosoma humi]